MKQVHFNPEPLIRFMEEEDRTQRWIAKKSGVSEPTISRLLNYSLPVPEIRVAEKLAQVVGCNPLAFYVEVPVEQPVAR